jgi:hypothetical protein
MIGIQDEAFCVVTLCSVAVLYQRFEGPCCLHLQGEGGGSMVVILLQDRAALQPRSVQLESLPS